MVKFGGYGFNKSHSVAYGIVAYQTAYLKANFPIEFMTAVLTSEIGHSSIGAEDKENKLVTYLEEARRMGMKILPPDVNKSKTAIRHTEQRYPLRPARHQERRPRAVKPPLPPAGEKKKPPPPISVPASIYTPLIKKRSSPDQGRRARRVARGRTRAAAARARCSPSTTCHSASRRFGPTWTRGKASFGVDGATTANRCRPPTIS